MVMVALLVFFLASHATPSAAEVRKIKLGMSADEVTGILGQPRTVEPSSLPYLVGGTTFEYSQLRLASRPKLWVHFWEGKVVQVFAKEYPHLGDDNPIYLKSASHTSFEDPEFEAVFR